MRDSKRSSDRPGGSEQSVEHSAGNERAPESAAADVAEPGGTPRLVWWITALHVAVLTAYSMLLPTYQAPDEPQHTDLAHMVSEDLRYPPWDGRDLDPGIVRSQEIMRFDQRSHALTVDEAFPKDEVPSLDDLSDFDGETELAETPLNYMPQHPPLYYSLIGGAGWVVRQVTGGSLGGFVFENWFYRFASLLFVAPLPLIIWRVARRLRLPQTVGVAATLFPLAVPQLLHNGSAVNNDSLLLLLFWLLTLVVLRLASGDLAPRVALMAGALTGLAMLTKGFALVLPLWVLAALVVAVRRGGRACRGDAMRAGFIYGVTSLAVGGWWWVRNIVVYGNLQPSRFRELYPGPEDSSIQLGTWLREWVITTRRFWGDFGWYFVAQIPDEVIILVSVVCLVALAFACRRADPVAHARLGDRLLLATPLVGLIVLQGAISLRGHLTNGRIGGMQGRYWFGAMAALAVVVALGFAGVLRTQRRYRWLPLGMLASAAVLHLLAVHSILQFYWGHPRASLVQRVQAMVAWAPLPGPVLALLAAVGAVPTLMVVIGLIASVRRAGSAPPGSDGDSAAPGDGNVPQEDPDLRLAPTTPA